MSATSEAKKTAAIILRGVAIGYDKLTARSVSFQDLARADCIFVKVHAPRISGPGWILAQATAREHGFRLETE